jgi:hypothetical protein
MLNALSVLEVLKRRVLLSVYLLARYVTVCQIEGCSASVGINASC